MFVLYNPWYSRQRHLRLRRRLVVDGAADVRRKDSERDGPRGQGGRARLPGQQYREVQGTSAPCRLDILSSSLATMHKGPFINDVYKIFFWNSSPLIYIVLSTQLLLPASPLREDVIYGWFPSTGKTVESQCLSPPDCRWVG